MKTNMDGTGTHLQHHHLRDQLVGFRGCTLLKFGPSKKKNVSSFKGNSLSKASFLVQYWLKTQSRDAIVESEKKIKIINLEKYKG